MLVITENNLFVLKLFSVCVLWLCVFVGDAAGCKTKRFDDNIKITSNNIATELVCELRTQLCCSWRGYVKMNNWSKPSCSLNVLSQFDGSLRLQKHSGANATKVVALELSLWNPAGCVVVIAAPTFLIKADDTDELKAATSVQVTVRTDHE